MISAVILNYLNPALTKKSTMHLIKAAEMSDISLEIIVVDNSAPETAKELHNILPKTIKIIENDKNVGFAKANNQGIKQAKGEVILIMNNDLFINEEVLSTGTEYVISNKNTGIWAPKLIDGNGKLQRSCAKFPSLTGVITEYIFTRPWVNRIAKWAVKSDDPVSVDTVLGACMFIRKEVFFEVGLFDEDYFFTMEDIELCYQMDEYGYEVLFDPRFEAVHLVGGSQDYDWYDDPYLHEARKIYYRKHFNSFKASLTCLIIDIGIAARKLKHKYA